MNEPVDIVSLLIALIAVIASREVAHLVGPYAALVVLACAGSALSLSGNEEELTAVRAFRYVAVRILVAVVLTVTIAELIQLVAPWARPRFTLVPLAFGIGWIKDYGEVRKWIGSAIDRMTARKIDGPK